LDRLASARERAAQVPGDRQSQLVLVAGVDFAQAFEFGRDGNRVENRGFPGGLGQDQHGCMAIAKRRCRVIPNRSLQLILCRPVWRIAPSEKPGAETKITPTLSVLSGNKFSSTALTPAPKK